MSRSPRDRTARRPLNSVLALVLTAAAAACGEDVVPMGPPAPPTGPVTRDEIVGAYDAVEMIFISGVDTVDVLAAGGSLMLTLDVSAQSSGRLVAPGQGPSGADIDEDMSGAWTYDIVTRRMRITQGARTFVGDAAFRPARTVDGFGLELRASVPSDQFLGNPAVEVSLLRAELGAATATVR